MGTQLAKGAPTSGDALTVNTSPTAPPTSILNPPNSERGGQGSGSPAGQMRGPASGQMPGTGAGPLMPTLQKAFVANPVWRCAVTAIPHWSLVGMLASVVHQTRFQSDPLTDECPTNVS